MSRSNKHYLEFANFICRFGDAYEMLDLAAEVVLPAIFSGDKRRRGKNTYVLLNPEIVDLGEGHFGVAFEFVKSTYLESEQVFDANSDTLREHRDRIESAPSAIVLLVLTTHRLVYMPKTKYAPSLGELAATAQILINRQRDAYIEGFVKQYPRSERVAKRIEFGRQVPRATVEVVPLASGLSIQESLRRFSLIKKLTVTLVKPNSELDYDSFFRQLRARGEEVGAATTRVEHSNQEGLDKKVASKEVESAAKEGNSRVWIEGLDNENKKLTQKDSDLKFRQPVDFEPGEVVETAKEMFHTFAGLAANGIISVPTFMQTARAKASKALKEWIASKEQKK
ncbi:hypothetical protein [Polyangium sp. 15x6]|uniref:hypothetical protein n=1 Tax=Polyangium sp. 15x6 TaxID=3042687 RepID=UPI00249BC99D|nr:hypothetical protein [Polyangium sp. 15x6]MDI3291021.1 hypothetical protein [Polyangium sp. 15x6]